VTNETERIAQLEDPFEVLRAATERMASAQQEVTELSRLRRQVIQDLRDQGLSYAQIAEKAGLTRGRIHQLRHSGPAPEGAFLGVGQIVIATPLKEEFEYGSARPVVAAEDFNAANRLGELARTLGLDVVFEQIPLGGEFDLNREGLVVICGPRLSAVIGDAQRSDPALQFERQDDGAYALRDLRTGEVHRSGDDLETPEAYDVAYLARLQRPDASGLFLSLTGIHPPGTLGVAQYLATDLAALHKELGQEPFSVLLRVEHGPDNEPVAVEPLTPIYRHREG
jgi:transcriptional regulator with XRE-family HTH domain